MGQEFNKKNVRAWMRLNCEAFVDYETNEMNFTLLAEGAACAFEMDHIGGPLDDSNHWIWELPLEFRTKEQP